MMRTSRETVTLLFAVLAIACSEARPTPSGQRVPPLLAPCQVPNAHESMRCGRLAVPENRAEA